MSNANLQPDIDQAREFLALLDSAPDSFTFQIIPERTASKVSPRHLHGSIDDVSGQLVAANLAGAGIFVMVNAGDQLSRRAANVKRIRAHFVDLDETGIDPLFEAEEVPPHIVVESSRNKWHLYWLAEDGASLEDFPAIQKALANRFGGDISVSDLPRVMRLPGFFHQKKDQDPFMTCMHAGKEC